MPALLTTSSTSPSSSRDGRDPVGVGDVELHRHQARVGRADGREVAHAGVDLRGAALEQRLGERLADPAVGAGDQRGGSSDLHVGLPDLVWMMRVILA